MAAHYEVQVIEVSKFEKTSILDSRTIYSIIPLDSYSAEILTIVKDYQYLLK